MAQGPCVLAGLQGWAFKAADYSGRKGCCWLTLCTVAQVADANSDILVLTPGGGMERPIVQASSAGELVLCG